jgi:hypothetical protein
VQKRKVLTEKRRILLKSEHKAYNKRLRERYLHSAQLTFDDYVDYVDGYYKVSIQNQSEKQKKFLVYQNLKSLQQALIGTNTKKN